MGRAGNLRVVVFQGNLNCVTVVLAVNLLGPRRWL
jgi:hypothetical protein